MNLNFGIMYGSYLGRVLCISFVNSAIFFHRLTELKCYEKGWVWTWSVEEKTN